MVVSFQIQYIFVVSVISAISAGTHFKLARRGNRSPGGGGALCPFR